MNLTNSPMSGEVVSNREVISGHFLISLALPPTFKTPYPGQFLMMKIKGRGEPLLGRPFSVYAFRRRKEEVLVELLYRIVGKGTLSLSSLRAGDTTIILGPLGRAFEFYPDINNIILIAGGVGIVPIVYFASYYKSIIKKEKRNVTCFIGAQKADKLIGMERIEKFCDIKICTEDGSRGFHGLVTELFQHEIDANKCANSMIYACGPSAMIRQLAIILEGKPIACQISIEERMACGLGACLGCAVAVKDQAGEKRYKRVCKEGPVFNIKDLVWN